MSASERNEPQCSATRAAKPGESAVSDPLERHPAESKPLPLATIIAKYPDVARELGKLANGLLQHDDADEAQATIYELDKDLRCEWMDAQRDRDATADDAPVPAIPAPEAERDEHDPIDEQCRCDIISHDDYEKELAIRQLIRVARQLSADEVRRLCGALQRRLAATPRPRDGA